MLAAILRDTKIGELAIERPQQQHGFQRLRDAGLVEVIGEHLVVTEATAVALDQRCLAHT